MITVHVNAPGWPEADAPPPCGLVRRAVTSALLREGADPAEMSVTFVGDEEIAGLHERYMGLAGPTDVLSFALHAKGEPPLGDVYVGRDQAIRQAADERVPADEEMARLAVHGALHVLGRDHPKGAGREACDMFRVQEAAVRAAAGPGGRAGAGAGWRERADEPGGEGGRMSRRTSRAERAG